MYLIKGSFLPHQDNKVLVSYSIGPKTMSCVDYGILDDNEMFVC